MKFIIDELAKPLIRRLGTALGGFLLTVGVLEPQVDIIVAGAMAAASISIDLIVSNWSRK